ncbi:MAG: hypothetical protein OXE52_20245 [Chloroflexi bacterium]|nr:hypothetical protein [Chloroflexota bacterium]
METDWESVAATIDHWTPAILAIVAWVTIEIRDARARALWRKSKSSVSQKDTIVAREFNVDSLNEHYFELRGDVKALSRDVAALSDKVSRIEHDLEATRNAAP